MKMIFSQAKRQNQIIQLCIVNIYANIAEKVTGKINIDHQLSGRNNCSLYQTSMNCL